MSGAVAMRRGGRPAPRRRPAGRARPKGPGIAVRAMQALSIDPLAVRRWAVRGGAVAIILAAGGVIWWSGFPQRVAWETGEAIGRMGFAVRQIEVSGVDRMAKLPVYAAALDQPSNAMPLIDIDAVRDRLLAQSWVKDAEVSRRLPDTLSIRITERVPVALWQNQGRVVLIDDMGVALQAVDPGSYPKLPLVVGEGANQEVTRLQAMLEGVPALKPEVADAVWVGGRRWDLHFRTGESLALPEGDAADRALKLFARLDAATGLLKRGFVRFDMRLPDRMVVRVSKEPGKQVVPLEGATKI